MSDLVLGLDIGIGSVGVGILNKVTGEIIHKNSRIFPAAQAENNVVRRTNRQGRRLTRRKKHRRVRLNHLFEEGGLITDFTKVSINLNPYQLRVKGLTDELSNEELFIALKNMVKHRGISYLDDASDDGNSSAGDYAQIVKENSKQLETKTPGQIQLERYQKYGQLRGDFTVEEDGKKHRLINVFPTSAYRAEALRILQTQREFNPQITDEFINSYLQILTGKRKYYHGPGNEKSRTDYGRYTTKKDSEDEYITLDNIFGILIGKCTFYPEEYRAAKASYTAQEFNLLNDLNNLTVPTETKKLSEEQKNQIITYVKNEKAMGPAKLFKYIAKLLSCDVADIKGYRIDKSDKAEIHTFEAYRKMKTLETIDIEQMEREKLDKLAYVLTLNTEKEGIQEALEHEFADGTFSQEQIDELVQFRKANSSIFGKGWHSFSVKLMMELIPELYATSEEQMTILTRLGKQKTTSFSNKTKYIDEKQLTEEVYNPVVAKSVRQAIKIVNAAIKEYGDFDNIVIEMARETNEDDEKKAIKKIQEANKSEKDAAMRKAANQYNGKAELPHSVFHGHKQLATKIRLWHQQGERCLYTGKTISIHDLINNPNRFEIDHILPLSITFDDSLANKVLVYATANQEKGQRTPYQALESMDDAWSFRELKAFVRESKALSNKKKEYLLTEEDISKFDVRKKFIERNLVDTRYASRVVLNALQEHFRARKIDTKVSVVRGQFTSQLRRHWGIDKTRDTYHHHAVDALIIAASSQLNLWKKQKNTLVSYSEDQLLDIETGELISDDEYKESVFKAPYQHFVDTLRSKEFEDSILFSYQVDSKFNRKISDATIYATRKAKLDKEKKEYTYTLGKIKDIYALGTKTPSKTGFYKFLDLYKKDKSQFLMYQKDRKTWDEVIEKILEQYRPFKEKDKNGKEVDFNPFEKYRIENGPIRKYSRKGNGPEIKSLKYYDNLLGRFVDITPSESKNPVALLSLNPWRTDVYYNTETRKYEFLGLKYADLCFEKGGSYGISKVKYNKIREKEGIGKNSEFKFTLYKNDLILIKDTETNRQQIFRFWSRTGKDNPKSFEKHKIELKPYEKARFEKGEELEVLGKVPPSSNQLQKNMQIENLSIYKVRTDVLGDQHIIKNEGDKPKLDC
ncbi:type II CRISPR RNA-guided endonuclease Cas9 [Streptococcus salivarius]|uniref:type II CRISPR RNA-guided endonuclease Cas9 n=1 Tax=Streptococcus salivarius TaxID=1304 RepID=UPI0012BD5104|nr:type II CRISPR RNA-guided endonuclease Cas9 [Streptococcus salivarius]MTQ29677.1 type II CRISPR RNA-guided endonuclease Cas9 [Streptococcus salivarius]MTQ36671.1 type II CRISPR RNA-guided endonuclease Cas9 [Streptococcus salivarius]MTQ44064.1 type II CRISPR RNA-guided endonuclease Cas9 [Streptococcus salivarius]MTQ45573.1 type II CRISPR RNA-guided endonuclease Cas9 [Streptococcus salivarius]MTQ55053.1 type II CRISPR RNA-guided endonuclease Cas9 [Streptococcus salivarius]